MWRKPRTFSPPPQFTGPGETRGDHSGSTERHAPRGAVGRLSPAAARQLRRVLALPADRGLRVPVRLRGHRAGGAERVGRVDVPAEDGRPERLRRDAGPGLRLVEVWPG